MKNNNEWKQGWRAVFASTVGMGSGIGLYVMVAGLFVIPLEAEFGWSRSEIATAGLLGIVASVMYPVVGIIVDRIGARLVAVIGMALLACGYVMLSYLSAQLWAYYTFMMIFVIVGILTGPIVFTQVVNTWFVASRGMALGVTLSGATVTAMLMLPLLANIIDVKGWRTAFLTLACVPFFLGLPVCFLWLKERCSDAVSLAVGGDKASAVTDQSSYTLSAAAKDRRFWLLGIGLFVANIAVGGLLSQMQPLLAEKGYSTTMAATIGSTFAVAITLGRLSAGWLLDRFWAPAVACLFLLCPIAGIAIMLSLPQPTFIVGVIAVLFFGLAQGAEVDFLAFFVPKYFGLGSYATIFGVLAMLVSIGMAVGGVCFGYIFDRYGSYQYALEGAILAYLFGAICVLGAGLVSSATNAVPLPAK